jgi:hypothetical protein
MTARFSALLFLSSILIFASPALGQSLLEQTLNGSDKLNIQVKASTSFTIKRPNVEVALLTVDGAGNGSYSTAFDINGNAPAEPMDFDVTIDTSGKRPVLLLDDLSQIEADLAVILRAHNPRFRVVTVTIDPDSVKTKLKVKAKITLNSKINIDLKFIATSRLAGFEVMEGKLKLRPRLVSTLPGACSVCGATYTGTSAFETFLNNCGVLDEGKSDATLVIDPDDDDGSADFTLTDSLGTVLVGVVGQAGRRLSCNIGTVGQDILLNEIETQIVASCSDLLDELNTASLDAILRFLTCEGRANKSGTKVSIDFFMNYRTVTIPLTPGQAARQGPRGTQTIDGSFRGP